LSYTPEEVSTLAQRLSALRIATPLFFGIRLVEL